MDHLLSKELLIRLTYHIHLGQSRTPYHLVYYSVLRAVISINTGEPSGCLFFLRDLTDRDLCFVKIPCFPCLID